MKIALLCSGYGNVLRGHEVFVKNLFDLLKEDIDIVLYKGGGKSSKKEVVVNHIPRYSNYLEHMHLENYSKKWRNSIKEEKKTLIELKTFAYSVLKMLLQKKYDIIHCTEKEICDIIFENRYLFEKMPKIMFSNGGGLVKKKLPNCDVVQQYTKFNYEKGNKNKSFIIPYGVDLKKFNPSVKSDFRKEHNIPENALMIISVGTICFWHKRMDYLIKEVSKIKNAYLVIVGQESTDSKDIKKIGKDIMGNKIKFLQMPNEQLPKAYKAADIFALASLYEGFGIVYIEAMAMKLPVIATNHTNQKNIIKKGIFIDMKKPGELTKAIKNLNKEKAAKLGEQGREIVEKYYDYNILKQKYINVYEKLNLKKLKLEKYNITNKIKSNIKNLLN